MTYQTSFIYLACQTCQAKIHCEKCAAEAREALLRMDGVDGAEVDMVTKTLSVSGNAEIDEVEIKLEDLGLLVD